VARISVDIANRGYPKAENISTISYVFWVSAKIAPIASKHIAEGIIPTIEPTMASFLVAANRL
jgi:hypothetical protein